MSTFPWLSAAILFPIGSAFVIPFFPDKGDGKEVRWFALSIALITFLITVGSYINGFDINNENVQLKENINWLPNLGLTWSVGADGISMPLISGFPLFFVLMPLIFLMAAVFVVMGSTTTSAADSSSSISCVWGAVWEGLAPHTRMQLLLARVLGSKPSTESPNIRCQAA